MGKILKKICLYFLPLSTLAFSSCTKKIDIGIILPTKSEPRWLQDEKAFKSQLGQQLSAELLFVEENVRSETDCVEEFLKKKAKILIIAPHSEDEAIKAVEKAKSNGMSIISYDRLITNTQSVDYFVTFDSFQVGVMQGLFLNEQTERGSKGNPLYLYAGSLADENSFIFFSGAWSVLQPKIADGTYTVCNVSDGEILKDKKNLSRHELEHLMAQISTDWNFQTAKALAEKNLAAATEAQKKNCFILAPNDDTARAISNVFYKTVPDGSFIITGQDAENESIKYILNGKQDMTIWKNTNILAKDAINLATDIIEKRTPITSTTYNNGKKDVPTKQTAVTVIDKNNVNMLIDSDYNGIKAKYK